MNINFVYFRTANSNNNLCSIVIFNLLRGLSGLSYGKHAGCRCDPVCGLFPLVHFKIIDYKKLKESLFV